jgi:PAS domain S-box-containing protein
MEQQTFYELEHMKAQFDTHVISSKLDIHGNMICVSTALANLSGYNKEELLGMPFEFLHAQKNNKK